MNKEAIKKWTDALRSGKYKQGIGALKRVEDGEICHCCLGVACEVFKDELNLKEIEGDLFSFDGERFGLPRIVSNHLEFNYLVGTPNSTFSIVTLNDSGIFTFEEIADIIDNNCIAPEHLIEKVESL